MNNPDFASSPSSIFPDRAQEKLRARTDICALPGRTEFPAKFIIRLHRNDARPAATGFLGFIIIRATSFHRLIEQGFVLEPEHILKHLSRIYGPGDFVPDKWDKFANDAHPSLVCKCVWPITNQTYRWAGEIRMYSDQEDRLATSLPDDVWPWAAVAEVNGYLDKDEGGKIDNYVTAWVRTPYDGGGRISWSLVQGVKREN